MDADADPVVTIGGRVAREGFLRRTAAALPVQTRDGVTKVDPIDGSARVRAVHPTEGQTVKARPRFWAIVRGIRARYNAVFFIVKGSRVEPERAKPTRIGRGTYRTMLAWPRRLSATPHELTIVSWGRAGFRAEAVRFKARGRSWLRVRRTGIVPGDPYNTKRSPVQPEDLRLTTRSL